MPKIFVYDTEGLPSLTEDHSLYACRDRMARFTTKEYKSEVTIVIQMYNDLEKAKRCVESVLKYTKDIDFDLMLMIDGPKDGLFDYFKNIEYEKTTIIYNTANRGGAVPWSFVSMDMFSEFIVGLAGDLVVTENWLNNLLKCIKSDPTIGMVVPMSSNVSNLQDYDLGGFVDEDDMQRKAAAFNVSDPRKWEERMRIVTISPLMRKSVLSVYGFGDFGFAHNFSDDNEAFTIRRMGYKVIVAKDTWIHHDHYRVLSTPEEAESFNNNIELGRKDFKDKYYGVDAWDDVNNYIFFKDRILNTGSEIPQILGIDVKCGTPILDIKNTVRYFNKFNSECYAITSDPKYYMDLQSICGAESVVCGDVIRSLDKFVPGSIDYIIIDKDINTYENPFELISKCASILKPDGHIYVHLKNTFDIFAYMNILGHYRDLRTEYAMNYSYEQFIKRITDMSGVIRCVAAERYIGDEVKHLMETAEKCLQLTINKTNNPKDSADRIMTKRWTFDISLG